MPSVADTTFWTSTANLTGSVPDWISSAIRSASALDRLVMLLPSLIASGWIPSGFATGSTTGVEISWSSTTIALGRPPLCR